ncbi:gap junction beta-5 protein-like [Anolis carolinensis]|uniref:gap junction beta-5 protein-like n=1 Tax=Anolis carolinensis TaxID=28377 RepID=UPI002F2B74B8
MEVETLSALLSGTGPRAPRLCRAGLSLLTAARLVWLALGAQTLWRDETSSSVLQCNGTTASCSLACFDDAFPVSPFDLFLLQMASVACHGVACAVLFRPPDCQAKGPRWWHRELHSHVRLHTISLLAKVFVETLPLMLLHGLHSPYPSRLWCPPSPPSCPQIVFCDVRDAAWKNIFVVSFAGASWLSVSLCAVVLWAASAEILARGRSPALSLRQV